MKTLLLFVFSVAFLCPAQAALVYPEGNTYATEIDEFSESAITLEDLRTMRNRDIREHLGRKLTLGESLAFSIIRGKLKKQDRRKARRERRNTRRAERGLPPLADEVDKTVSWLALGSFALLVLLTLIATGSSVSGGTAIVWLLSLIGSIVFGGQGRRNYRDVDSGAFTISNFAFWGGLIFLGLTLATVVGLFVWLS